MSVGLDAKGDGFDRAGGADTIWNAILKGSPAGNDAQKDVRTLVFGTLGFQIPLKNKNKQPITFSLLGKTFPLKLGFALASASILFDTTPGDEVVSLRAVTTKMPWEEVPVVKDLLAAFNVKLDVNGYWRRKDGQNSGGMAFEVLAPTPILVPGTKSAVPFRGLILIDSSEGFKLQGTFDFGKLSILGGEFDVGKLGPVEASYDGEKFCIGAARSVSKPVKLENGATETTTCSLIPCFGKKGFEGSKVSCSPHCFVHSECAAGQACIFGTCQAPRENGGTCSDNGACKSGRCYSGFCVECWPGSSECGTGDYCDNAGYCQGKLENGAVCVNLAGGSVYRNDWCKSGKCDGTCVECFVRTSDYQPTGTKVYNETCGAGTFCDAFGACKPKLPGGATCFNVKQASGVDAWCEFNDCHDVTAICQDCGPDTSNTCPSDRYCLGSGCQPKVADDTACALNEACTSGTCGVGVVAGTGSWCYSANSRDYDATCKVAAACKSGGCRLLDGKCGCNGDHAICESDEYCDGLSYCQPKKPSVASSQCVADVECESGHCAGVCVECTSHAHCGASGWCDAVGVCHPKADDGTLCVGAVECQSGYCGLGVTTSGGPASYCYTPASRGTAEDCKVNAQCASGACRATDGKCSCNGDHGRCATSDYCDALGYCQAKKPNGPFQGCGGDVECASGHCLGVCVACTVSADCASGEFCDAGFVCQVKLADGALCLGAAECQSGFCGLGVTTTGGPATYCYTPNSQATGEDCKVNAACVTGACRATDGKCSCEGDHGLCAGTEYCDVLGFCQPKKSSGPFEGCAADVECRSNHCLGVCVGCTTHSDCLAGNYCDAAFTCQPRLPDGSACLQVHECLSGACGLGVTATGGPASFCYTPASKGYDAACKVNAECTSGGCRAADGKCSCNGDHGRCATSDYCDALGYCQAKKPNGPFQGCGGDVECASGHCLGVCVGCKVQADCGAAAYCDGAFACQPRLADGALCLNAFECASGSCGLGVTTSGGPASFCYAPGSKGYDAVCKVNAECTSGGCRAADGKCGCNGSHSACASNQFCDALGYCQAKKPNGPFEACGGPSECLSGRCLGVCVECQVHGDCGAGTFCGADFACKPTQPDGSGCLTGAECQGGTCTAGFCGQCAADADCGTGRYCAGWRCFDKKAFGSACVVDAECATGYCNALLCASCKG